MTDVVAEVQTNVSSDVTNVGADTNLEQIDASQVEATSNPDMFTVKIDGKEMQVSREELIAGYQIKQHSNNQLREAAELKKQAAELLKVIKDDPKRILSSLGVDVRRFSEDVIYEMIQEEAMSPEEKEHRDLKQRLEKYEAQEKEIQARERATRQEKMASEYANQIVSEVTEALKDSPVSKKHMPAIISEVAKLKQTLIRQGRNDVSTARIVQKVMGDFQEAQKQLIANYDTEQLIGILGKDAVAKLMKQQVAVTQKMPKSAPQVIPKKQEESSSKKKRTNIQQWRKSLYD